jgi:hypothetical protein
MMGKNRYPDPAPLHHSNYSLEIGRVRQGAASDPATFESSCFSHGDSHAALSWRSQLGADLTVLVSALSVPVEASEVPSREPALFLLETSVLGVEPRVRKCAPTPAPATGGRRVSGGVSGAALARGVRRERPGAPRESGVGTCA